MHGCSKGPHSVGLAAPRVRGRMPDRLLGVGPVQVIWGGDLYTKDEDVGMAMVVVKWRHPDQTTASTLLSA